VLHIGALCPSCGHERKPSGKVDTADGDLVEITGRKVAPTMAEKERFWAMALWIDRERNKGGKLAKALYKGRFGVWRKGIGYTTAPPDQAFLDYGRSGRIAYAKKMGGKGCITSRPTRPRAANGEASCWSLGCLPRL